MQSHINSLRSLSLALETVGSPVSDEDLAVVLLCSLPSRFDPFIVQMDGRPSEDVTFNFVSSRLLAEFERQSSSHLVNNPSPAEVFTASRNSGRSGHTRVPEGERVIRFCKWCFRSGHLEDRCWDKEDGKPRASGPPPLPADHRSHFSRINHGNLADVELDSESTVRRNAF